MPKEVPINPRIVEQLAKATVKNLVDGIVELVTNCDDSYKKLKEKGTQAEGKIEVSTNRKKGGICETLVVKDFAGGMSKEELEKAIEFGGETSGFEKGKSVRGLFGRGLKETIISLGEGEVETIKDGKINTVKIWWDKKLKRALYDFTKENEDTSEKNGTCIRIQIINEKITIFEYEKFKEQVSRHYALRDINSSEERNIGLSFEDIKRAAKLTSHVTFKYPDGHKVIDKEINLKPFGDKIKLVIFESP
jgi:hypothetical protein